MRFTTSRSHAGSVLATATGLVFAVAACGSGDTEPVADETAADETAAGPALSIEEPWVKAADAGMTAAFGTLVNTGAEEVHVVSVESAASAYSELHEVVMADGEMKMREKDGGFVIAGGADHLLEPGGDHLMLMQLTGPVTPGDEVEFVLTLDDGSTFEFTAQAKDFAGADEDYQPGAGHDG